MHLHIAYSSDNNYVPFLGTSIISLLENNKVFKKITLHILSNKITEDSKNKLEEIVQQYKREAIFYDFSDIEDRLKGIKVKTIAISAYSRLFLTDVLPESVTKIIYLDCDSIILGSYEELWNSPIDDYYMMGVQDVIPDFFKDKIGLDKKDLYVNSGMLYMNIEKMRINDSKKMIRAFMDSFSGEIPHHDQGVMNGLFSKNCNILKPRYNCMTPFFLMSSRNLKSFYKMDDFYLDNELEEAVSNPVFIHFTESYLTRPWVKGSKHPFVKEFLRYKSMTPWSDMPLKDDTRTFSLKMVAFLFKILPFSIFMLFLKLMKAN
ncbi:MAG: glycosyltransferase family 8 protein [Flavobacteriaceae bacterium]|nr:glycosyltransferase family 8 protein [Flavobacteriaceae bacterium]